MSTFVGQWDPEEVLGIGQVSSDTTCIGHARTQGRRCRRGIVAKDRTQAANLLSQMSRSDVTSPSVRELERLGRLLLCDLEQHEAQLPRVVRDWCNQIARFRGITAEWEHVIRSDSAAVHQWTTQLEKSMLNGDVADIQKTVKLLRLAQKRETGFQTQLTELQTQNADLNREVESLRTQLAHSASDLVHNRTTPVTSPVRARQPSADSSATFTNQISAEDDLQPLDCHGRSFIHRIHIQLELQCESAAAPQQPCLQTVSHPERSFIIILVNSVNCDQLTDGSPRG